MAEPARPAHEMASAQSCSGRCCISTTTDQFAMEAKVAGGFAASNPLPARATPPPPACLLRVIRPALCVEHITGFFYITSRRSKAAFPRQQPHLVVLDRGVCVVLGSVEFEGKAPLARLLLDSRQVRAAAVHIHRDIGPRACMVLLHAVQELSVPLGPQHLRQINNRPSISKVTAV